MQLAGVETRMQLGWHAAAHGWLVQPVAETQLEGHDVAAEPQPTGT
jgi:hypothetical protein